MMPRRDFASVTACAVCALTGVATAGASAQSAPAATTTGGVTRKILSRTDGPVPGYVTVLVDALIPAGVQVVRHTHPGIESAYLVEGGFELPVEGQPTRLLVPGDNYQIPVATPHGGGKPGATDSRILITYVVEKDKPLTSPA